MVPRSFSQHSFALSVTTSTSSNVIYFTYLSSLTLYVLINNHKYPIYGFCVVFLLCILVRQRVLGIKMHELHLPENKTLKLTVSLPATTVAANENESPGELDSNLVNYYCCCYSIINVHGASQRIKLRTRPYSEEFAILRFDRGRGWAMGKATRGEHAVSQYKSAVRLGPHCQGALGKNAA